MNQHSRKIDLPELTHRDSAYYNGQIDYINDNSWVYTSHTNNLCTESVSGDKVLKSPCRKVNSSYSDSVASNRIVKTIFNFTLLEFNLDNPPEWNILFQDWVRVDPNNPNGNPPITTVKIITIDDEIYFSPFR